MYPLCQVSAISRREGKQASCFRSAVGLAALLLAPALCAQETNFRFRELVGGQYFWGNPDNWSNGVPDLTLDAVVHGRPLAPIDLGGDPREARSLTLTDGEQAIRNGPLRLQPATIFDTSLTVGIAPEDVLEHTDAHLTFSDGALTSSNYARIGVAAVNEPGTQMRGIMTLDNSIWLHQGRIDVQQGGAVGQINLINGSALGGGIGTAPSLRIGSAPESNNSGVRLSLWIDRTSGAVLDELRLDARGEVSGSLSVQRTDIGTSPPGNTMAGLQLHLQGSSGEEQVELPMFLGQTTVGTGGDGYIATQRNVGFTSLTLGGGESGSMQIVDWNRDVTVTIGEPGPMAAFSTPLLLGVDQGSHGTLSMFSNSTALNNPEMAKILNVNGGAIIGQRGVGTLGLSGNSTMTLTGDLVAGQSAFDGQGTGYVNVLSGSTLTARNIYVGTSQNEMFGSVQLYPTGTGTLHVEAGGVAKAAGEDTGYVVIPGKVFIGSGGLIDSSGTIIGEVINKGIISPGNSPGKLTIDGNLVFKIPFGFSPVGGKLVIELGGLTGGIDYDVLHVTGNVDLRGGVLELSLLPDFTPGTDDVFNFLLVDGFLSGQFAGLIDHTGLGLTLENLVYGEHGVSFSRRPSSSVPDPGWTVLLLGLALVCLALFRRRQPGRGVAIRVRANFNPTWKRPVA